jgi:hypothetical protein
MEGFESNTNKIWYVAAVDVVVVTAVAAVVVLAAVVVVVVVVCHSGLVYVSSQITIKLILGYLTLKSTYCFHIVLILANLWTNFLLLIKC